MSGVEKGVFNYQEMITYDLHQQMKSSAVAYGSGTTGTFAVVGDMTVTGDIDAEGAVKSSADSKGLYTGASDDLRIYHDGTTSIIENAAGSLVITNPDSTSINIDTDNNSTNRVFRVIHNSPGISGGTRLLEVSESGSHFITGTTDFTTDATINSNSISDALMLGSANAAYVPCSIIGHTTWADARQQAAKLSNTGAGNMIFDVLLPAPTNKGSLKLYLKNFQFGSIDADNDDFVTSVAIYGLSGGDAPATIDTDGTDHKTTGAKVFSGAVMPASPIDCSAYGSIIIGFTCTNTGGFQLDLADFLMECYYDT